MHTGRCFKRDANPIWPLQTFAKAIRLFVYVFLSKKNGYSHNNMHECYTGQRRNKSWLHISCNLSFYRKLAIITNATIRDPFVLTEKLNRRELRRHVVTKSPQLRRQNRADSVGIRGNGLWKKLLLTSCSLGSVNVVIALCLLYV